MNKLKYPNIEAERVRAGFSQEDLVKELGYRERKSYYNWLASGNIPTTVLIRMSEIFNCTIGYLLGVESNKTTCIANDIAIDLKQRRLDLGLTMLEVAKIVGVSEATISRYESGNIKNMRRDRINKYAQALNVDPTLLLNGIVKRSEEK